MNRFTCDCGKSMQMPSNYLGKRVQCRQCGTAFTVASAQTDIGEVRDVPRLTITLAPNRLDERIMLVGTLPITFGKARGADVQIDHPTVSRKHGTLKPHPHGWIVEDAGSTNGIIVNGNKVQSHQLTHGDIVRIGDIELTYTAPGSASTLGSMPALEIPPAPVAQPMASGFTPGGVRTSGGGGVPLVALDEFDDDDDEGYQVALDPDAIEPENLEPTHLQPVAHAASPSSTRGATARLVPSPHRERREGDIQCDGCDTYLPAASAVCTRCGTKLASGRPLIMSVGLDVEELYERAHTVISPISWFPALWLGVFPFASDAGGSRKPIAIWVIAALTCLVSFWYFTVDETPAMQHHKNLMLWPASPGEPDATRLQMLYTFTNHGDTEAYEAKLEELTAEAEAKGAAENGGVKPVEPEPAMFDSLDDFEDFDFEALFAPENPELVIAAHKALEPHQRATGEFHGYQLLTHALLHGGWLHLAGNMLFMFVFGTRVNALIGNAATAVIYPILAIFAAIAHMISTAGEPATAMLGASGAIMGLAGMYFVLFPVQHVHMAIWLRILPLLLLKMFALRGFWVIAFYIGQDILFSSFGADTGTAHWAHLGGFIAGMVIGLMLLLARIVTVQGDLLSVTLGRGAWGLVGRPGDRQRRPTLSWGVFGGAGPGD